MSRDLLRISEELCAAVEPLRFEPPVTHVYNPLVYARLPHRRYLRRYGVAPSEAILLAVGAG